MIGERLSSKLLRLLEARSVSSSLAVVGDLALDRYLCGTVERISREAPIPVVVQQGVHANPGCAGNGAMNLAGLGCAVGVAGAVGEDGEARELAELFHREGVRSFLLPARSSTVLKTRVVSGRQQMLRVDRGTRESLREEDRRALTSWCRRCWDEGTEGLILSDYGYGVCDEALCRELLGSLPSGVPGVVDPRGSDWSKYRGAALLTPNLQELAEAAGRPVPNEDRAVLAAAEEARGRFGLGSLLVTRSEAGMTLVGEEGHLHVEADRREVFDVSGAGDTVIATVAALLAAGIALEEAVGVANRAAGLVVQKAGTRPIGMEELAASYRSGEGTRPAKEAGWEEARRRVEAWKAEGLTVAATNGCFDALHGGHLFSLGEARRQGDRLVVAVNSDASVRGLKGPTRPLFPLRERVALLSALEMVDLVVPFDEPSPETLYRSLRPHVLVKGEEYRDRPLPEAAWADRVVFLPRIEGLSTTALEERIRETGRIPGR